MKKILIFQLRPGIGDMCIFLSSIYEISKKHKGSEIHLITKKRTKAKNFLKDEKYIKNIIYIEEIRSKFKSSFISLFFFLKNYKFSEAFIMHYGVKYFLICKFLGIKKIFSYGFIKKNETITMKIFEQTNKWLNINSYNNSSMLSFNGQFIQGEKILIGIGSSGESRKWDTENFVSLCNNINDIKKFKFILLGGPQEKKQSEEILSRLKSLDIMSLCQYEVYETFKYIKNSLFYIGTDSAFMHLSAALNVRTFALYGDTPVNYSEYSKNIIPIMPEGFENITHGSNAMHLIKPDHVFSKIYKYII